jgi:RNA-directed DNA polymerase
MEKIKESDIRSSMWNEIKWKRVDRYIHTLQNRIYNASKNNDLAEVQKLQKTLMKSSSAKLKAVRKVSQDNRGKKTPGVDGVKELTPIRRWKMAQEIVLDGKAKAIRRVWIPKPNSEEERPLPLGIPTMKDRAKQALAAMALEPEWEAKFETNSYGFRPGRSCHDAVDAIFASINKKEKYVLEGYIAKCFDKINNEALLEKINTFPAMRKQIKAWFKAGIMDGSELFPSETGTPQGGVISPLLANIALHGMENMLKEYISQRPMRNQHGTAMGKEQKMKELAIVRYADDFVILHPRLEIIEECKEKISEWLASMGLELKPSKTHIVHSLLSISGQKPGFNFLGFNIRQYSIGKYQIRKNKLALKFRTRIKPQREKTLSHIRQISTEMRKTKDPSQLLLRINPIIAGWTRYYRSAVSAKIFQWCDAWLFRRLFEWAAKKHPTRGAKWIRTKYFLTQGDRNWVFGYKKIADGKEQLITVKAHVSTPIERHVKVQGDRSPYDGDWVYWGSRLTKYHGISNKKKELLKMQRARCTWCRLPFFSNEITEIDHIQPTSKGGPNTLNNLQLLHGHCHDEKTGKKDLRSRMMGDCHVRF